MKTLVEKPIFDGIMNYLNAKPYGEVFQIWDALKAYPPEVIQPPEKAPNIQPVEVPHGE